MEKGSKPKQECWTPRNAAVDLAKNSALGVKHQRQRSEPHDNRTVTRSPWETIGISDYDPARVALAQLPTARCPVGSWLRLCRHSAARLLRAPGITGVSGRVIPQREYLEPSLFVPKERMPLWYCEARTWRRQDYVIDLLDTVDPWWADGFAPAEKTAGPLDPVAIDAVMAFLLNPKSDPPSPVTTKTVLTAYRACALRCHPDLGGSHEAMITLTAAKNRLLLCVVDAQLRPTEAIETFCSEKIKRADFGGRFPERCGRYIVRLAHDKRDRPVCITEMRRAERDAAAAVQFPAGQVLTREMFVEQLGPTYALIWPWPTGRNEIEAGVLDYTILRLLDWSPGVFDSALGRALVEAGWARAPYARAFEDRRHFGNWLNQRAEYYARSLGRNRGMIPAMYDDIPVQFKANKVALLGEKRKTAGALALYEDRRVVTTDPTVDIWDAIAESTQAQGRRFRGLPNRATGRAEVLRRVPPRTFIVKNGAVTGPTLGGRYGARLENWKYKSLDWFLDEMEETRQRDAAKPRKFAGRYNDAAPTGFARDDIGDAGSAASRAASGTRRARGAAAARAVVEQIHHKIAFREWVDAATDDYETLVVIAKTLINWYLPGPTPTDPTATNTPHDDLARLAGLDPEVVRAGLALAFDGLRAVLDYEAMSRTKVEAGIKRLAIHPETLEAIAGEMLLQTAVAVPSTKGGRPRKLDPKLAAERMTHAATILRLIECDERLFLTLEDVTTAPSKPPRSRSGYEIGSGLQAIAERLAALATVASAVDPANGYKPPSSPTAHDAVPGKRVDYSIWEIIDVMEDSGLFRDRQLHPGPGAAAQFAITLAWWTAPTETGLVNRGVLQKLLQEYIDREPRPPALARPVPTPKPGKRPPAEEITLRRHAADVRAEFRRALRHKRSFEISGCRTLIPAYY